MSDLISALEEFAKTPAENEEQDPIEVEQDPELENPQSEEEPEEPGIEDDSDADEDGGLDPFKEIFKQTEAISGIKVEADFEPTIEGLAERDKYIYDRGAQEVIKDIETEYPEVYHLLSYLEEGGDLNTWINNIKQASVEAELNVDDSDSVDAFIKAELKAQGMKDSLINASLKGMTPDEKKQEAIRLKEEQENRLAEAQRKQVQELLKQEEATKKEIATSFNRMAAVIDDGRLGEFIIPMDQRDAFKAWAAENMRWDRQNKTMYMVTPVYEVDHLKQAFFAFKKGDLNSFIKAKAQTLNAEALKEKLMGTPAKKQKAKDNEDRPRTLLDVLESGLRRNQL